MGVRARRVDDRPDHRGNAVDLGEARDVRIGVDDDDAVVIGTVERRALPAGNPELDDLYVGDPHGCSPPESFERVQ